jgi:hypothetical protein
MLIHSRVKLTNKRLNSAISTPPNPILSTNPEIQVLVDKVSSLPSSYLLFPRAFLNDSPRL